MTDLPGRKYVVLIQIMIFLGLAFILTLTATPAKAMNGGVADNFEHPNVGLMAVFYEDAPVGACSSTLISKNVVLTAAHCIENALSFGPSATVMVNFNEDPLAMPFPDGWHAVVKLIPHPEYYPEPLAKMHDIGLLILKKKIRDIPPAILPKEGFLSHLKTAGELVSGPNDITFTVVGFGITLDWPCTMPDLIPQPRQQSESGYRSLLKAWLNLSQNEATGDGGSCFGDSGGPVFWKDSKGIETIVGITSWGDPHCVSPSFNYRVDIADSLDFISPYLVDGESD